IAYLLSASAVRYLYSHGGEPAFAQMLERWAAGASLDEAMRASYQFTLARFEQDWSRHVRREYGWLRFLAQGAVVWSITGVIVVAIWMIRHRYNRARLARLRANEIPDDPAFWILQEPADGPEPGAGDGAAHGTDGPDDASPGQVTRRPDAARPGPGRDGRRVEECWRDIAGLPNRRARPSRPWPRRNNTWNEVAASARDRAPVAHVKPLAELRIGPPVRSLRPACRTIQPAPISQRER